MEPYRLRHDEEGRPRLGVPYRGQRLLRHPMFSKGTAFTSEERTDGDPSVRDPGTPGHPLWRTLRWILAALAAWWLLWILLRGASV
jgi:hypothetical protein